MIKFVQAIRFWREAPGCTPVIVSHRFNSTLLSSQFHQFPDDNFPSELRSIDFTFRSWRVSPTVLEFPFDPGLSRIQYKGEEKKEKAEKDIENGREKKKVKKVARIVGRLIHAGDGLKMRRNDVLANGRAKREEPR